MRESHFCILVKAPPTLFREARKWAPMVMEERRRLAEVVKVGDSVPDGHPYYLITHGGTMDGEDVAVIDSPGQCFGDVN